MTTHPVKTTGTIKWINEAKSFGLITPDDGGEDLFASFPVPRDGDQSGGLKVKQTVSYDVEPGHHGGRAVNVQVIPEG
jgi:cold shock protein